MRLLQLATIATLALSVTATHAWLIQSSEGDNDPGKLKKIYKYVDENGKVFFSDTPIEGAEEMTIRETHAVDQNDRIETIRSKLIEKKEEAAPAIAIKYDSLKILSPVNDQAIYANDGILQVQVELQPQLKKGHTLRASLGEKTLKDITSTSFQFEEVERGTHTLSVSLYDEMKNLVKTTTSVVHIHKAQAPKARLK